MAIERHLRTVRHGELAEIAAGMDELAAAADGRAWLNLEPDVDDDAVPQGSSLFRAFSARGPAIPLGTWTPAHRDRDRELATSVGIRHPAGRDVVARLAHHGVAVPADWVVGVDHPKQGLIVYVPPGTDHLAILHWMTRTLRLLAPFDFADAWRATFLHRR